MAVASEVRGNAAGEHRYQPSPMQPEKVVRYFDDVERLRHLLVFYAQRRLWCKKQQHRDGSQREVPYSTSHLSGDSYAVDVDLNIYSRPYQNEGDDLAIHHSSYLAGKAVLCAGMIIIDDGKLLHIDNESGHYKPSTSNLLNLLAALRLEHQIPLANVTTKDVVLPNLDGMSVLPLMYFPAARYLAQRGQMSEEDGGSKDSTPWWEDRAARCVAGNLRADS
ncbi:MAG: hypothetical protein CMJ70_19555 [Planctomycetaceae bacterium]|nr:hypothetical protein [Planctomycetaceae bacterium]